MSPPPESDPLPRKAAPPETDPVPTEGEPRPGDTELESEVADPVLRAQEQLLQLRRQQEALEKQKRELEDLNARQAALETARAEVSRKLMRGIVALEREQYEAEKEVEHLRACREKLEHQINLLEGIDPAKWPKTELGRELTRVSSLVEDAEAELEKASARINTRRGEEVLPAGDHAKGWSSGADRTFLYWLKAGVAFTLPLLVLLAVAFAAFFHFLFNILAAGR